MNTLPLWSAFTIGLVGSLHCLGMCGPLALALPVGRNRSWGTRLLGRLLYNLGRTVTYAAMGLLAGAVGKQLQLAGFQRGISLVMGIALLLSLTAPARWIPARLYQGVYAPLKRRLGALLAQGTSRSLFVIGLFNGLLPCGLVYGALALASLQANALDGLAYMAFFGFGTIPLMFVLSVSGSTLSTPRFRPVLRYLIPTVTFSLGVLLILRGMALGIPFISPDASGGSCCH